MRAEGTHMVTSWLGCAGLGASWGWLLSTIVSRSDRHLTAIPCAIVSTLLVMIEVAAITSLTGSWILLVATLGGYAAGFGFVLRIRHLTHPQHPEGGPT